MVFRRYFGYTEKISLALLRIGFSYSNNYRTKISDVSGPIHNDLGDRFDGDNFLMSKRVSHSFLDPIFSQPLKSLYSFLKIPARVPPEAIVATGHLFAIVGAMGFAFANQWW